MDIIIYFTGILLTLLVCIGGVLVLKDKFYHILVELTGNKRRANFWLTFSNILLIIVPLIFAMSIYPEDNGDKIIFEVTNQFKWGLIGFSLTIIVLGLIMVNFIKKWET